MDMEKLKSEIQEAAKRGKEYLEEQRAQAEMKEQNEKALNLKRAEEEAKKREEEKRAAELARADEILAGLPKKVEYAARKGDVWAHVMFLGFYGISDFRPGFFKNLRVDDDSTVVFSRLFEYLRADDLVGVAKLVFEGCEKVGRPFVHYRNTEGSWWVKDILRGGFEMMLRFDIK
jgi:hypothetical protein